MNLRPSGYEPDELPGCSTPRQRRDRDNRPTTASDLVASPEVNKKPAGRNMAAGWKNLQHCDRVDLATTRVAAWIRETFDLRTGRAFGRPGSDLLSRALRHSTIGAESFHGRVRNGIGCIPLAITTRPSKRAAASRLLGSKWSGSIFAMKIGQMSSDQS